MELNNPRLQELLRNQRYRVKSLERLLFSDGVDLGERRKKIIQRRRRLLSNSRSRSRRQRNTRSHLDREKNERQAGQEEHSDEAEPDNEDSTDATKDNESGDELLPWERELRDTEPGETREADIPAMHELSR